MNFNEYQTWVGTKSRTPSACSVVGLCGEAAEVDDLADAAPLMRAAGHVADDMKKVLWHGKTLDRQKLKGELGDVLWYLADIARANGISLQEVANFNVEKINARHPTGFSIESAQAAEQKKAESLSAWRCHRCGGEASDHINGEC